MQHFEIIRHLQYFVLLILISVYPRCHGGLETRAVSTKTNILDRAQTHSFILTLEQTKLNVSDIFYECLV